jgi:hypothetical protein
MRFSKWAMCRMGEAEAWMSGNGPGMDAVALCVTSVDDGTLDRGEQVDA